MKQVIIKQWCDRCARDGQQTEAESSVRLALGKPGQATTGRALDLCEPCRKTLLEELSELLAEYGQPDEQPKPAGDGLHHIVRRPCPVCGQEFAGAPSNVYKHIWATHIGQAWPAQVEQCPDCSYHSTKPSAMGRHRTVTHKYDPVAEAFAIYKRTRNAAEFSRELGEIAKPSEPSQASKPAEESKPADETMPTPVGGVRDCPICEMSFTARTSLVLHIWQQHIGRTRPVRTKCPDCGWKPEKATGRMGLAGVGSHRRNVHGYDPLREALDEYRKWTRKGGK